MSWDHPAEPGAWARKVCPPWTLTRWEAAARIGVSLRWLSVLLKRYPQEHGVYYVKKWVKLSDGQVKIRYAQCFAPQAVDALALEHLARSTNLALQSFTRRRGSGTRARWHGRW